MIKYFKELDNFDEQYISLVKELSYKDKVINQNVIPIEFYKKHKNIFNIIREQEIFTDIFTNNDFNENYDYHESLDEIANICAYTPNSKEYIKFGLTDNGRAKINVLINKFNDNYIGVKDYKYYEELRYYIENFLYFLYIKNNLNLDNPYSLSTYLRTWRTILEYQNIIINIDDMLEELNDYSFNITDKRYKQVTYKLPNAYYITPYNHLWNTMGPDAHKETNLYYSYYEMIKGIAYNPQSALNELKLIERNKCINKTDFSHYLNYIAKFIPIYPEYYYKLNNEDKFRYRLLYERSYDPKLVNLIIGIISAHAGFDKFCYDLKTKDALDKNIDKLSNMSLSDILVRCAGFHKISSVKDKTITTSIVNYEDEFKEYIDKGWTIDFIKPFVLNEDNELVEYNKDFLTIKKLLKK